MSDKVKKQNGKISGSDNSVLPNSNEAPAAKRPSDLIIVGIGASAGGLDALQRVLPGLPGSAGMAYIIVQHLAPKHHTLLPSLLAKHTKMPIETIEDGMPVQADTIYITPPNKDVTLQGNQLKLSEASTIGPRPSIDYFFTSLADQKHARAVGIILSGTGTDGAHGIRAIKSNDGITMAQTAESAKFDGMPHAAISTGLVDLVLPPEKMGQEIENALKYPNLIAKAPVDMQADEIDVILDLLLQHTGVDFKNYKLTTIKRRISRRMVIRKADNLRAYLEHIKENLNELSLLQKDLLISVTSFFRDGQAFEALAERLRKLFDNKRPGDAFRAWVPGCATGEEAYTIAILVAEIVGNDLDKYKIQIFATDLDEDAVMMARKGEYPLATVMETEGRRFENHFSHHDNIVKVNKHIRDMVVLARQDLIKDTPFMHLDLISCRNLMIYLKSELQDKLLSLFHYSLNPEGILFLGKSESVNKRMDLFSALDNKWKIFRRKDSATARFPQLVQSQQFARLTSHKGNQAQSRDASSDYSYFGTLLGVIDSCAVVTESNGSIIYVHGDMSPYFKFPQGRMHDNLTIADIARPEIRYILQSMLHKTSKNNENGTLTSNRIALEGDNLGVQIKVGSILKDGIASQQLIVFSPVETPKIKAPAPSASEDIDHERMRELEQELSITREHLQDTIEELETSSEELQSLNEELQSANEELQASNEELETSNEELQASNEELNTVNDELRAKSEEANNLLENYKNSEERYRLLVDNMNEAVMLCEIEYGPKSQPSDLIIKQANQALTHLIDIDHFELPLRAGSAHLHELLTTDMLGSFVGIVNGKDPQRFEVHLSTLEKDLTLSVYKLGKDRLGVVCLDDTKRKQAEQALRELNDSLEQQVAERTALAESRSKQLQALSIELIEAEERERRRIAQLLHDDFQQLIAGAKMQLQLVDDGNRRSDSALENVEKLLETAIEKSRHLSQELSPPVLNHAGLIPALEWLARQVNEQFGLNVQIESKVEHEFKRSPLSVFLFRAVQELLFNVVKHAMVKSALVEATEKDNLLSIKVSDHGKGFDKQVVVNTIEPTGFGLLSLKERISSVGGELNIESAKGQGSTISLSIPLRINDVEVVKHTNKRIEQIVCEPAEPIIDCADSLRIIFVDDHEVMRKGLIRLVGNQSDFQVVGEAENGQQAIALALQLKPDVVVMDVSMPGMDGIEATRRIKADMPNIRIIGLSMHQDDQVEKMMRDAGASNFISKTASPEELIKAICED